MSRLLPALLLLSACGDPLFGGESLDTLLGVRAPPTDPQWELRWLDEDGALVVDCRTVTAPFLYSEEAVYGSLIADAPGDVPEPAAWAQPGVAIAIVVMVEGRSYRPFGAYPPPEPIDEEDEEEDDLWYLEVERLGPALAYDLERGVWGLGLDVAYLRVEPGAEDEAAEYLLGRADPEELPSPDGWLGLLPSLVRLTGSFDDALFPIDRDPREDGVEVSAVEHLGPDGVGLLTGGALDGVRAGPGCE